MLRSHRMYHVSAQPTVESQGARLKARERPPRGSTIRLGGSIALSIAVTVLAGTSEGAEPAPTFVGSSACSPCHAEQYQAWHASQHQAAMQDMSDKAALGNFAGARFTYGGITSTFFRRDGGYYVRTDGPDGKLAEFRVRYTFGVVPLQQYLVEMPGGRLQALPIAWDVAGKRWIHLYPKERVDHNDELH